MSEIVKEQIRPHRSDINRPEARPLPLILGLTRQSTSTDQDDDGHSRETVKSYTPVLCQYEISTDLFTRDATTPVVIPEPSPLPLAPDSPLIQFTSPSSIGDSAVVGDMPDEDEKTSAFRYERGRGSQRMTDRSIKSSRSKRNKGVVIGDFNGLYADELSIKVGEEIEIISKDTVVSRNIGWWTGRKIKGKIGIFPAACISCHIQTNLRGGGGGGNSDYPLEIKNSEVEIKEVIGIGGFGKVFRGIYRGEEVAVKIAKTTTFDSLKAVQDVISEAEKFAHLAHHNVCALVGVVLVKDVCLVMECAQGGALSDVIHKRGISLSIDIITDWASQIGSGMRYLHHEADPSLIHRDLKTSNILLADQVDPLNLRGNTIKITDFGLAREIEHTTHMSGAGTYPWMAPEVIISSDFSKKSDVWSFGVVLWEMVTGERPYGGLNLYVVAFGVGNGTLSLPIPGGCPDLLANLMRDCWRRDHARRLSFNDIMRDLKSLESSDFYTTTSNEDFLTMQSTWRGEIQKKFVEQKKMEPEFQRREEILDKIISEQEEKKKELEKEKTEVRKKNEQLELLIRQLSSQQKEPEDRAKNRGREEADGTNRLPMKQLSLPNAPTHQCTQNHFNNSQLVRPPRVKPFSIRKLIRKLWGTETKVNRPLPDKMESIRAIRRITSSPATNTDKRAAMSDSRGAEEAVRKEYQSHKRRNSDNTTGGKLLTINTTPDPYIRRGSVPSSPNHNHTSSSSSSSSSTLHQPIIAQQPFAHQTSPHFGTRSLKKGLDNKARQRSWSDLRSPSPQQLLLPSYLSPIKGASSPKLLPHLTTPTPSSTAIPVRKPAYLGLHNSPKVKIPSHNSPSSPNVTITPAEHPLNQYDSGKDSLTCSDASGHSNCSETHPDMIKLDSPMHAPTTRSRLPSGIEYIAEFDPLRPSISHDSLLFESKCTAFQPVNPVSASPTPMLSSHRNSLDKTSSSEGQKMVSGMMRQQVVSTSPKSTTSSTSTSPKQSLIEPSSGISSNNNMSIVRPRPKPSKDILQTISAPSSRPPSPKLSDSLGSSYGGYNMHRYGGASSPTGSVQSMKVLSLSYDSETYFDSDTTSDTSSLIDLGGEAEAADLVNTIVHLDFDMLSGGFQQ